MISMADFASQVRQKYPAYAQVPDDELVSRLIQKYPMYRSQVQLDPRTEIGTRPTATTAPEEAGPIRRFLQGAGVPTSVDEMQQMAESLDPSVQIMRGNPAAIAGPVGLAGANLLKTVGAGIGTQAGEALDAAQQGDYRGAMKHSLGAAVPLVGPQAAEGDYAGAAGTVASLLLPTMAGKATGRVLESMGAAQKAPLTETLGSQIAAKSGKVFTPSEPVTVPKFKGTAARTSQLEALTEKYPNSTIYDEGENFRVEANQPAVKAPSGIDKIADTVSRVARPAIGGAVGGAVGSLFGEPALGAKIGVGAVEAASALKSMVNSPLWRSVSGTIKQSIGKAMQAQDFSTVSAIASKVLSGQGLDDEYGHDQALSDLMRDIQNSKIVLQGEGAPIDNHALHQMLQDYTAVYIGPNGVPVEVPHNIQRQTQDQLSGH